jgi:nicotinamidase-related amidase
MSDRTALLVMDVQIGIVNRIGGEPLVAAASRALQTARAAGVPVIHVQVAFRPGHPEVSPRNKAFAQIAAGGGMTIDLDDARIHPGVAPGPGEVIVQKRRVSAFSGSDLEVVLRAKGLENLVLAGIATSGVVLSTVRQAADLDYGLVVLRDACADADDEVHRLLIEKVFPRQANVLTIDEWAASLAPAA